MPGDSRKRCFVVMGFGKKTDFKTSRELDLDKTYRHIIKKAVEGAGLECVRADEIVHSGTIDVPMYQELLSADLVIADLSTSNLNAVYELGVRHALRPRTTIVIAETQFESPFDVNHIVIRKYQHDGKALDIDVAQEFSAQLEKAIKEILKGTQSDSPVYTFLHPLTPPSQPTVRSNEGEGAGGAAPEARPDTMAMMMEEVARAKREKDWVVAGAMLARLRKMAPSDPYLVQQHALVTYKSKQPDEAKALDDARAVLLTLNPMGSNDAETLGLFGAIHKRRYELLRNRADLDTAIASYEKGYRLLNDYYNGINWAYLLNVRADQSAPAEPAEAIADFVLARRARLEVLELCRAELQKKRADTDAGREERYWILATMAEAYAGIGDEAGCAEQLASALALGPAPWMRESTDEQLARLRPLIARSPVARFLAHGGTGQAGAPQ